MALDYRERKKVGKNRPKKQPVGMFAFLAVGAVATAYALGVLSGWFIFKPAQQNSASAKNVNDKTVLPNPIQAQRTTVNAARPQEPSLTFYETLAKGNKAVIGSGLNPKRADSPGTVKPASPPSDVTQSQQSQKAAKPPAAVKVEMPAEHAQKADDSGMGASSSYKESTVKKPADKFFVQIASYRDRKEAEAVKSRLAAAGLAAYIVESDLSGKGIWYRLRVGKHLDQKAADELAGRAGKGAMVIPE